MVSGADDFLIKVWDDQTKQCIYTFDGHKDNIADVIFHPDLPIIISAAEDNKICVWNANTYKLETTIDYELERVWSIHALKDTNLIALGFDEATVVIKVGKEYPLVSYNNGKIAWFKQGEILNTNLKLLNSEELKDGDKVKTVVRELGSSEVYAQNIRYSPNGRFFAVVGDSEYVIYNAQKFANTGFGAGLDLVWSNTTDYAVSAEHNNIQIFKNFA